MSTLRIGLLTLAAMMAFAANSLLCRLALAEGRIDPASFTLVRVASGACLLCALALWRHSPRQLGGDWVSALALLSYAAGFSFAYVSLTAATGALLLFGAVQATMIGYGVWAGERLTLRQVAGLLIAGTGLLVLLLPGAQAPSPAGACLMLASGVAWGTYSLRGRGLGDPTLASAGHFLRATPLAALLCLPVGLAQLKADTTGLSLAIASGALASGAGYAIWYAVLPHLRAISAASVQLSVPVLTAAGAVVFLAEPITMRLLIAAAALLGGLALFLTARSAAH